MFLTAASKIKLPPVRCIVFEDSFNGLLAAKRANMYGIGVRHQNIKVEL